MRDVQLLDARVPGHAVKRLGMLAIWVFGCLIGGAGWKTVVNAALEGTVVDLTQGMVSATLIVVGFVVSVVGAAGWLEREPA